MPEGDVKLLVENTVLKSSDKFREDVTAMLKTNQTETKQMVKEVHDAYIRNVEDAAEKAKEAKKLAGRAHDRLDEVDRKLGKIWVKLASVVTAATGLGGLLMFVLDQLRK